VPQSERKARKRYGVGHGAVILPTLRDPVCSVCFTHWRVGDALWFQAANGGWLCFECYKETGGR
jgi:hypothetical protein